MLKAILYGLASFLETGLGIWVYEKMFPKRDTMGRRQILSEWGLFTGIIYGAYSFPKFFYAIDDLQWYLPMLIIIYILLLVIYIVIKMKKKELKKGESQIIIRFFYIGMSVWIAWQYWTSYHSSFSTLLGNGLPVLYLCAFYKGKFIQKYLWELFYLTNMALFKVVYITYVGVFNNKYFEEFIYCPRIHSYSEIIYLLVVYIAIFLIAKHIPIDRVMKQILISYRKALFLITICEWGIALVITNFGTGKISKKNLTATLIIVVGIMFLLVIMFAKFLIRVIDKEKNLFDARNEAVERQYLELSEAYENYRCLVHDEKHRMFFLRECLASGEIEKAESFIRNYQDNIFKQEKQSWTGHSTLDFMLNIKKRKMKEFLVEFQLECKIEGVPMEDADFVVVLGNLFDNAIEAVEKCDKENRKIMLSLQSVNEMFILKMKNSSAFLPHTKNNRFVTDKKERNKHGWGIESIKHIVAKYNGHVSFQYDTTVFEVSIILNE